MRKIPVPDYNIHFDTKIYFGLCRTNPAKDLLAGGHDRLAPARYNKPPWSAGMRLKHPKGAFKGGFWRRSRWAGSDKWRDQILPGQGTARSLRPTWTHHEADTAHPGICGVACAIILPGGNARSQRAEDR